MRKENKKKKIFFSSSGENKKKKKNDIDSVERFDDFRRRKSSKIAQNRGRKSPKIAKNHAHMMQIIPNFWKGSQLCLTLFQGDYFGLCSYYFFLLLLKSSIGLLGTMSLGTMGLKSSFWRDFQRRKSSNNIHFRPLMKQIRPLHKIGP